MNYNVIINLAYSFDEEQINKIIKIQATIRGMEMRDKIKLKSKKKKQKEEEEIIKTDGNNINNGEFIYENKIKKEIKENDIELYNKTLVDLFTNQIKLKTTEESKEALLCIFFINLGYIKEYDTNKTFFKIVVKYLLKLMENSKVNYTILMNCFSMIMLKKEVPIPNKDELLDEVKKVFEDEADIKIVETFIKKCFYIFDR